MLLGDYYRHDPRVTLVPIEHLSPAGLDDAISAFLEHTCAWPRPRLELLERAFVLYWERSASLAARSRTWPAPRLRHIAVVHDPLSVRPYAQMLNTSAWTLYASDIDAQISNPELAAYLLALGDRMAATGEVTLAAVHAAPWWFERSDAECAAFSDAAARATRPDADALRAVAGALPWLRQLRHETLRPAVQIAGAVRYRPIPNSGLLVPLSIEKEPPRLVEEWARVATAAVARFHARWKAAEPAALEALLAWLETDAPPLLVTGRDEAILWDHAAPARLGPLRRELRQAGGAALRDMLEDLRLVAAKTRSFLAALGDPEALPQPVGEPEQRGYAYLHRRRKLIAYNLYETWTERLAAPALPYARAMLGARTIHEWCHLAVDAGWVPQTASAAEMDDILEGIASKLEAVWRDAPLALRNAAEPELRGLGSRPGRALAESIVARLADDRANVLAQRFLSVAERETYVRQNIRSLRRDYRPSQFLRALARYLYEYQYLRFSLVADPRTFFLRSTGFDDEFLRTRILDEQRFDDLAAAVRRLCGAYAVDEGRFRGSGSEPGGRRTSDGGQGEPDRQP